jgi:hypothetical protein
MRAAVVSARPQLENGMADPMIFEILPEGSLWVVSKAGQPVGKYSHVDRATHDAVNAARELRRTGEPARVLLRPAPGKEIEIDTGPTAVDRPGLEVDDGVDRSRA